MSSEAETETPPPPEAETQTPPQPAAAPAAEENPEVKVEVADVGPCKKRVDIAVARGKVLSVQERNYRELLQSVTLPGFRRGHVPRKLLEKRFGKHVQDEVRDGLIHETMEEAIEQKKLRPLGEPAIEKVEFDAEKDPALTFSATLEVKPEFTLPELSTIVIDRRPPEIKPEDVDTALARYRRARASLEPTEDPAGPDDVVIANVTIQDAEGGKKILDSEDLEIVLKEETIGGIKVPDLAAKLQGAKAGENRTLEATLPEDFREAAFASKKASLDLAVTEVKRLRIPDATDAWAEELGYDNLAELTEELKSDLLKQKDGEENRRVEEEIIEKLLQQVTFDLPPDLTKREAQRAVLRKALSLRLEGKSEEEITPRIEELQKETQGEVEKLLKASFVLDRLADDARIYVTEEEVETRIEALARLQGKWPNEVKAYLEEREMLPQLRAEIRSSKVRTWLRGKATVREVTA